jgi:hypothetical protein
MSKLNLNVNVAYYQIVNLKIERKNKTARDVIIKKAFKFFGKVEPKNIDLLIPFMNIYSNISNILFKLVTNRNFFLKQENKEVEIEKEETLKRLK